MRNLPNTKITKKNTNMGPQLQSYVECQQVPPKWQRKKKKQIQCKCGITNYNPLECQQAPPRWQRGSKGRECPYKARKRSQMYVCKCKNKYKYNHSSKYRNTTGNARLRNVGKGHPGDKKEGVVHLLENWRLRQVVMVPSIQTADCLP